MLTRLVCLIFALIIARQGTTEVSATLIALASVMIGLSLMGIGKTPDRAAGCARVMPLLMRPPITQRGVTLAGIAVGLSFSAVAISSSPRLLWVAILAWLLTPIALVALGLALDGLTLKDVVRSARSLFSRKHWLELGMVGAITLVALVLRGYQLEEIPVQVHLDEGWHGMNALEYLRGDPYPFFKSAPYTYPFNFAQALTIAMFGQTVFSLRAVPVAAAVLSVPLIYLIGRIGWGPLAGAMGAWLFAVSHLVIHYSRMGHIFAPATFLTVASMLLLALAAQQAQRQAERPAVAPAGTVPELGSEESGSEPRGAREAAGSGAAVWTFLLAAGAVVGLTLPIYLSTRVVPIIAGLLLLFMLWRRWIGVWHIAAFGLAMILAYAPMAAYYLDQPLDFAGRQNTLSVFQDWYAQQILGPGATLPSALPALLAEQSLRTFSMFINTGDFGGFYSSSVPAFDPTSVALMWLGFGIALTRIRRYHDLSLLLWAGITLLLGSIFILGGRNGQRIVHMTPAAFLLGGVLIARLYELLRLVPIPRAHWLVVPVVIGLGLRTLAANSTIYFDDFLPRYENTEMALAAREMRQDPGRYRVYLITMPRFNAKHSTVDYMAHGIVAQDVPPNAPYTMPPSDGRGVLVIAMESYLNDLRAIEAQVPGGHEEAVRAPTGRVLFLVYRVPPPG